VALLVATARMDLSGWVSACCCARWAGGLGSGWIWTTMHGMIVIATALDGAYVVGQRCAVTLPAALRHLCGIGPGPPAGAGRAGAVVHPAEAVARLLAGHYTELLGAGHDG
jgi:hypothetical protein